ncbi:hypothetical protein ONZ45_g15904 [Pleurotus djamor]|nr:hypothetical protein ONZ45_g15904 [Pleurotus djamor]
MAPIKNARHLFNEIPVGYPIPGKTTIHDESETIDLETVPLNGGILIKTLVLSIDPYLRGKMKAPDAKHYSAPFIIGQPLANGGVGLVVRSEHPNFKAGDHIYGLLPFQEYTVFSDPKVRLLENKEGIPWRHYVGAAGMPGQTAYLGWKAFSKAKKGETAFITTGAGPVGAIVAQIAKLDGVKVIASAGSDEKVEFMKSIGVDVAFNYKTTDTTKVLEEHGPIDIYWDNVGGEILEAALEAANVHARFIECGMISQYNLSGERHGIRNVFHIIGKRITINGFLVPDLMTPEGAADFYNTVPAMIRDGKLKFLEDAKHGLDKAGEAILDVQSGKNHGKTSTGPSAQASLTMPLVRNARHLFNEIPTGFPIPGRTTVYDDSQTIDLDNVPLNGGILVKTLVLSMDPYLRGKMRPAGTSYLPSFVIGEPLDNWGVGVVLRSETPKLQPGDHVYGMLPFQEYSVFSEIDQLRLLQNKEGIPWSLYVGIAGMPGQTAYLGWKAFAKPRPGETVFVTTGAGPVGSVVAQLAKRDGLKVIASAGSDKKVEFMKTIGVDVAFNYKTTSTREVLKEHGPIDIYWDHVGGETLETALDFAKLGARFIECGMITEYNSDGEKYGVKNLWQVVVKRIVMSGLMVPDLMTPENAADFYATVPAHIRDGKLKSLEDVKRGLDKYLGNGKLKFFEDTKHGLDKAGEAILDVQSRKNHGKSLIIVADE